MLSTGGGRAARFGLLATNQSWRPIPDEVIKEGLQVVLNLNHHSLLICSTSGIFETGLLVGCQGKVQGWNYNSIVVEYNSYSFIPLFLILVCMRIRRQMIIAQEIRDEQERDALAAAADQAQNGRIVVAENWS